MKEIVGEEKQHLLHREKNKKVAKRSTCHMKEQQRPQHAAVYCCFKKRLSLLLFSLLSSLSLFHSLLLLISIFCRFPLNNSPFRFREDEQKNHQCVILFNARFGAFVCIFIPRASKISMRAASFIHYINDVHYSPPLYIFRAVISYQLRVGYYIYVCVFIESVF